MEGTFLRIIFLVFPLIFCSLVDFSIFSNLGDNNQAWGINGNKYVLKTNNLISKDIISNIVFGDNLLLKGRLLNSGVECYQKQNELKEGFEKFNIFLEYNKGELGEMKKQLEALQSKLGTLLSNIACVNKECQHEANSNSEGSSKDLNENEYLERLNNVFKEYLKYRAYALQAKKRLQDIYKAVSRTNTVLSRDIVDAHGIKNEARVEYEKVMKLLVEVFDLAHQNSASYRTVLEYLKYILTQTDALPKLSGLKFRTSNDIRVLSLSDVKDSSDVRNLFTFNSVLLFALCVLFVCGFAIYVFHKKSNKNN